MMPGLVDYFVVCGLSRDLDKEISEGHSVLARPPLSRSFCCKLLSRFPDKQLSWNQFDEVAVRTLCMPDGLVFKKNISDPKKIDYHSFMITRENGTHSYGNALTFYELVKDQQVLNVLDSLQQLYSKKRNGYKSAEDYCFSTEDEIYAPKCICLITSEPIHGALEMYLRQLHAVTMGNLTAELKLECYLYNLLFEVPLPNQGKSLTFSGPLGKLTVRRPQLDDLPICDYSFKKYFELLGVRNSVKLLTCLLLEHQVLLMSTDYEQLMLVCNCAVSLLFPFSWPHVFVPFLPASQRGFLDAPVPYIMGIRVDPGSNGLNLPSVASLCTLDISSGSLEFPEELPSLPDEERLVLQLSEKIQTFNIDCPDLNELPSSPPLTPRKPSIIDALRVVQELTEGDENSDIKSVLTEAALKNPHIPNLIDIATRAGIKTLSPTSSFDEGSNEPITNSPQPGVWDYVPDEIEAEFSTSIREIFANYFVEHFANYDNFIIPPQQTYEQWTQNRDQFQNFDNSAFISDQPANCREFYSAFVESSMFSAFIDDKIVSQLFPEKTSHKLSLFEYRVEVYKDRTGPAKPPTTPGTPGSGMHSLPGVMGVDVEVVSDESVPLPRQLSKQDSTILPSRTHKPSTTGLFPTLDSALLNVSVNDDRGRDLTPPPPSRPAGMTRSSASDSKLSLNNQTRRLHSGSGSNSGSGSMFSSKSHVKFVSQLMRESGLRVKHMLGNSGDGTNSIEENTHIAYLCDLLERIWGHGLKKSEKNVSKSPLWAHLMAYGESVGAEEFSPSKGRVSPPHPYPLTSSMSSLAMQTTSPSPAGEESPRTSQTLRAHFKRRKFQSPQLRSRIESILHPRPSTLLEDLSTVHQMKELKTDVGRARAWVRLGLENKSLSRHLSTLLNHKELIARRYREYAFISTEEEREQFLCHLLTLTARDFSCFTTAFLSTPVTYRVLVVGEGKHFGLSTACLNVQLAGECGVTGAIDIPRGEYQTEITINNLGPLTSLRIGHDNTGITPSLFVEMVLVHNLTTGQTFRFNCGSWFARSEEDGSIERFLIASKVPQTLAKSGAMSALNIDNVLPPSPARRRATRTTDEKVSSVGQLMLELKLALDKLRTILKSKHRPSIQEILNLIHGPNGILTSMEQIFNYGFRSYRGKFQKRLYTWDLLERVSESLVGGCGQDTPPPSPDQPKQMFINAVLRVNTNNQRIGKEEKAMRFFALGLRDHCLQDWLVIIAESAITVSLYEENSFLRDPELLQNLYTALSLTLSLNIRLEPLFTQSL